MRHTVDASMQVMARPYPRANEKKSLAYGLSKRTAIPNKAISLGTENRLTNRMAIKQNRHILNRLGNLVVRGFTAVTMDVA